MQISPAARRGAVAPVTGSTILHSTCGWIRPTVVTRFSIGSSVQVWSDTGDVSVMPYAIVTSRMCIRWITCFITSTGHGAPPMTPVRSEERSNRSNSAWPSSAMNIVGTP